MTSQNERGTKPPPPRHGPGPKRGRRRRGTVLVVSLLVGFALLAALLWGADTLARQQVAAYVTEKVRAGLSLEADHPVTVGVGGFSVLLQIVTGSFEQVNVGVDGVTLGEFTGDLKLTAEGIPTDLAKPVERVQVEFAVSEATVQSAADLLSSSAIDNVTLVEPEIQFSSAFSIFGLTLDIGVGVEPYAANGEVGFTPTSVLLNGNSVSVSDLTETFGSFAEMLFSSRTVCIAEYLPTVLSVESVAVRDKSLVITIGAEDRIFSDASLNKLGRCDIGTGR